MFCSNIIFRNVFRRLIAVVFLVFAISLPVRASASDELFTVNDIKIDITAETASEARKQAMFEGQQKALLLVFERLTAKFDRLYLPEPAEAEIVELVQDVVVSSEKSSAVRYIASLTIRFKPEAIKKALRAEGIAFTENKSEPVLILPLFRTWAEATPLLWEENNPWLAAWAAASFDAGLVPIVVPFGDLADISAISAEQALRMSPQAINKIAKHYEVKTVYTAEASLIGGIEPKIEVMLKRAGKTLEMQGIISIDRKEDSNLKKDFSFAVQELVKEIEDRWKQTEVIQFNIASKLVVMVPVNSLSDWICVRKQLDNIKLINRHELQAMKRDRVQVKLSFSGSIGRLISTLAKHDFTLEHADGYWILQPSS